MNPAQSNTAQPLAWDTEQWGFPCFVAHHEIEPDELCALRGFTVLRVPDTAQGGIDEFIKAGAAYIGTELLIEWHSTGAVLSQYLPSHMSVELGTHCPHTFSEFMNTVPMTRFSLDKRLPEQQVKQMWQTSFANQCRGDTHVCTVCAVLLAQGKPVGIWNLKFTDGVYSTPFIGICSDYRGQGLGVPFMLEVIRQLTPQRIKTEVFSHNSASLRVHQRAGFVVTGVQHILHYIY